VRGEIAVAQERGYTDARVDTENPCAISSKPGLSGPSRPNRKRCSKSGPGSLFMVGSQEEIAPKMEVLLQRYPENGQRA
jgi:hypothetical protein